MKDIFFKTCEKLLTGFYAIKIKQDKYLTFPRLAPIFILGALLSSIGEILFNDILIYCGWGVLLIFVFGFFYYNIFPSRRPKGGNFFDV